ncbi:MAG: spore coat protein [Firmicutes bacterium]|nr:spore coat protein [Bacillota bacterium]
MNLNWTNKERTLLEDQISHEKICIQKYTDYANLASDQQLKKIFENHAQTEQEHLNTLNQLLNGQMPQLNQQGNAMASQAQQQQQGSTMTNQFFQPQEQGGVQVGQSNQQQQQAGEHFQLQDNLTPKQSQDQNLCNDLLMTEKYVSGTYDTAIFEFRDPQVREILNHIQKEEQQHGEAIFNYMQAQGMYNPQ